MATGQVKAIPNPRAEALVRSKEPTAFAEDDGEAVRIRITRTVTGYCPHCNQLWTRQEISYQNGAVLGSAGSETLAWHRAAVDLGLIRE